MHGEAQRKLLGTMMLKERIQQQELLEAIIRNSVNPHSGIKHQNPSIISSSATTDLQGIIEPLYKTRHVNSVTYKAAKQIKSS